MEFIITGLFIIFFSYILLHSLYNILFKRSMIEGVDNGVKEDANPAAAPDAKPAAKPATKPAASGSSDQAKATAGLNKANSANVKIAAQNTQTPNATYSGATRLVQTPSNP